jgi:rhodanese-related sulfurtransferase
MGRGVEELLEEARRRIRRIRPEQLAGVVEGGGLVVDIRPEAQRRAEGTLPGALVVERNVLEWRLDPRGDHHLPEVRDHDQEVVVVCSAGYASSLAAAGLADLGFTRAADLEGGYQAWRAWSLARPVESGAGR